MRVHNIPHNRTQHRRAPHQTSPIHIVQRQITPRHTRQTQDRNHQRRERGRNTPNRETPFPQVPGPAAEAVADEEGADRDGDSKCDEGADGTDTEDGADGDGPAEDEAETAFADDDVEPDGVDGGLGVFVDAAPVFTKGEAAVARVGEGDSGGGDHAALAHTEGAHDGQGEDGEGGVLRHDLQEIGGPGLAEVGVDDTVDVDDRVGDDELEEPAKEAAEAGGHDDGAGRGDIGVAALFGQVEGGVIAGHGPDHSDEGHEDGDAGGEVGAVVQFGPNLAVGVEAAEMWVCCGAVGVGGDEDDDDEQCDDVEGAAYAVEACDPEGGHGRDAAVNDHD